MKQGVEEIPSSGGGAAEALTATAPDEPNRAGEGIGPYRLLQPLGKGGMGEVWLAEQTEPVRRKVALKLIQWGMDTKAVIARFEAERQALALMDHPNIAKVLDAGATEKGRPYFVMEFVQGVPINQHCDGKRLNTQQRLDLFRQVCEGVQHAHQKGIIHRDIKPSNVLVTAQGEIGTPKIIDFGVAKATAQRLTEMTLFTQMGQLIGTPEYMSPEQADLTAQDIDTRTDVYSLGVLLYELLAGALPFESRELRQAGYDEIRRKIREDDPPKPSTRLSTVEGDRSTAAAKARRTDLTGLRRQLQGDLDWITMKALEKDRGRRYGSPNELAADVRRHLEHEPVLAGPPSTAYRMRKFVRRHRTWVGFAATLLLALVVFSVTVTVQAGRIARERDRANAEAERANSEGLRASREADTANRVSEFMVRLFEIPDPGEARGNTITAREILDRGSAQIDRGLKDEPIIRARMMATMGSTYGNLGLTDKARRLLERALEDQRDRLPANDLELARTLFELGWVWYQDVDRARSIEYWNQSLAIFQHTLTPDDPELLFNLATLGWAHFQLGRTDEAATYATRVQAGLDRHPGTSDWRAGAGYVLVGTVAGVRGERELAVKSARELVAVFERSQAAGNYWSPLIQPQTEAGRIYTVVGLYREALQILERALQHETEMLGPDHPNLGSVMEKIGMAYFHLGNYEDSRRWFQRMLELDTAHFGPDHLVVSLDLAALSLALERLHRFEDALALSQRELAIRVNELGPNHSRVGLTLQNLALLQVELNNLERARRHYRRAMEIWSAGESGVPWRRHIENRVRLARKVGEAGLNEDALELFEFAIASAERRGGELLAQALTSHAELLRKLGRDDEAADQEARAATIRGQDVDTRR